MSHLADTDFTNSEASICQMFRTEREKQQISIDDVAKKLKLEPHNIEKIENNELNWLELSPFQRGYIRNYASLLGISETVYQPYLVDSAEKMSELRSVQGYDQPKILLSPFWGKLIVYSILIALLVVLFWLAWPTGLEASEQMFLHSEELMELHQRSLSE